MKYDYHVAKEEGKMSKLTGEDVAAAGLGLGCLGMGLVGCLLMLAVAFLSRAIILGLWIWSDYLSVYQSWYAPALGFLFAPWSTLAFAAGQHNAWGAEWIFLMVLAVAMDLKFFKNLVKVKTRSQARPA